LEPVRTGSGSTPYSAPSRNAPFGRLAAFLVEILAFRFDDDVAVARHPRGRDQFADDDVFLEAEQRIVLALDRGVGEDARRLLKGRRREERLGRKRRLGDAEQNRLGVARAVRSSLPNGRRLETASLIGRERQCRRQERKRLTLRRPTVAALERTDTLHADPGALGQGLLRKPRGQPIAAQ
jgi:hypothetical protein